MNRCFSGLALLLCCAICCAQPPDTDRNLHWVSTWGTAQQLAAETLPGWVVPPPREPLACLVQLRAHGEVYGCRAQLSGDTLHIELDTPAMGVAPGQAAVLYDGDIVVGSATIARAV